MQNKWTDRSRPLVIHACSSTTYPYTHFNIYRQSVYAFYQRNPCKMRFALGPYVRCCAPPRRRTASEHRLNAVPCEAFPPTSSPSQGRDCDQHIRTLPALPALMPERRGHCTGGL